MQRVRPGKPPTVSSQGGRDQQAPWGLFCKDQALVTPRPPTAPLLNAVVLGIRSQQRNCGRGKRSGGLGGTRRANWPSGLPVEQQVAVIEVGSYPVTAGQDSRHLLPPGRSLPPLSGRQGQLQHLLLHIWEPRGRDASDLLRPPQ